MKITLSLLSGLSYGAVTYFRNLIPALARQDKFNQYHIFLPAGHELLTQVNQDNFVFHEVHFDTKYSFLRHFWEQFILPCKINIYNIDILFTAKNTNVFLASCKTIISIRNMEPLCFEQYKNNWKLNIFSWLRRINTMISVRKATRIIAVSKAARNRLIELIPRAESKIDIIYNGNPLTSTIQQTPCKHQDTLRYLLTASKFVAYANQLNLLKGYALLSERMNDLPPLWLAGGVLDKQYYKRIQKFVTKRNLQDQIKFLGLVAHERLSELYQHALAFVFPSTLEACPQTLIEAMASGVPIAASHTPPMPEICQQAAIYFDPYNPQDIADKIEQVLKDSELRVKLHKCASERVQFFSWDKTAEQLMRVFRNVDTTA